MSANAGFNLPDENRPKVLSPRGPDTDYHALAGQIQRRGHIDMIPRAWYAQLGTSGAVLLARLLNAAKSNSENGWLLCSPRFLEQGTGINPERQGKILARLHSMGIVTVIMEKGKRRVCIHGDEVMKLYR